jgi:glycerol kinase
VYDSFATKIPITELASWRSASNAQPAQSQEWLKHLRYRMFYVNDTGDKPVYSKNNFETTVAWKINGNYLYLRRKCICRGCNGAMVAMALK